MLHSSNFDSSAAKLLFKSLTNQDSGSSPTSDSTGSMAGLPTLRSEENQIDLSVTEVVVVRHGETEWNSQGRFQGQEDVPLNDRGKQQSAAVADRLSKEHKISVVYSSDLTRALETAEIIAKSCGGVEVIKDSDMRERHLGDLQGLVYDEAALCAPMAFEAFRSLRTDQEIPGGGESLDQVYDRCTSFFQKIGSKHKGERVVVVTHGCVIGSLFRLASPNGQQRGDVLNASVNIFHLFDGNEWVLKVWG